MQKTGILGIYLAKEHAAAVCLSIEGRDRELVGCFSVSFDNAEQATVQALAQRIAAGCAERSFAFTDTAVALDCGMFMQHSVRSEFSDIKRISQTVRFDTEEVLGADATDVAIAFKTDSVEQLPSAESAEGKTTLSVFTAQKQMLAEVISALAANNLDPVSVEPDVNCLARFVITGVSLPADTRPLFAVLSRRNGYFIAPLSLPWQGVSPMPPAAMRTFLLSPQDRTEQLVKQVSMTAALLQTKGTFNRLEVLDAADSVNCEDIAGKLTLQTEHIDLADSAKCSAEQLADCPDSVEFAVAYGAALAGLDPPRSASWRSDFMPYQGKRMRLQKAMKFFAAAAVVLMFALGLYGLMQALQLKKYHSTLHKKFAEEYAAVMSGEKMPNKAKDATTKLSKTLRRVKDAQEGYSLVGEEAVAGKLGLVLQAFNKCASGTGLEINTVSITERAITISGSTAGGNNSNTLKVFEAMKQSGLNILQQNFSTEGGRGNFNVTVEAQKTGGSV